MTTVAPIISPEQASTAVAMPIPFHADSPRWQSALRKAEQLAAVAPFVFGSAPELLALGTNENHMVRVSDAGYQCDCTAAQFGRPCVHAAGAVLKLQSRLTSVVAPKPARKIYDCALCGRTNVSPLHSIYGCDGD